MKMWKCKQCGKCCKIIVINITGMPEDQKLWLSYHEKCMIDGNKLIIRVKCKHLKHRNRKYICDIHGKKPDICTETGERECEGAQKMYDMEAV